MNYGYGSNQTNNPSTTQDVTLPTGSRLAQYLQGSSAKSSSSTSMQNFAYATNSTGLINDPVSSVTYPLSQMGVGGDNSANIIEDGVTAFLNGNYASSQHFYPNSGEYAEEDEDAGDAYYAYQSQPARIWKNRLKAQPSSAFFVDSNLKAELISRQLALQASSSSSASYPNSIEQFHNVTMLSVNTAPTTSPAPGRAIPDTVYRAVKSTDGQTYCLRRISTPRPLTQKQLMTCENWKKISHSNIVQLREVLSTRAFNDNSYVFVYDFYPLAQPLKLFYFGRNAADNYSILPRFLTSGQKFGGLPELLIWTYIIQLSSAIRYIHSAGLAIRFFDVSRLLVCGKSKILLSLCGISDFSTPDGAMKGNIVAQQVEDLRSFGHILLILVVGKLNSAHPENIASSLQYVEQNCSMDLRNVIQLMCGAKMSTHNLTTINEIMPMIGARFYGHVESLQLRNDFLEDELSKEVENGRLYRILCKLNTVNERLDPNVDVMWSETGDRYFLKLFRDYVFHQINPNGKPWIDLSHISMCLNKLDAGVNENIQLVSRDGDNVLIVSFAELRKCLDNAFNELISPQFSMPAGVQMPGMVGVPSQMMAGGGDLMVNQMPQPPQPPPSYPQRAAKRPLVIAASTSEDVDGKGTTNSTTTVAASTNSSQQ